MGRRRERIGEAAWVVGPAELVVTPKRFERANGWQRISRGYWVGWNDAIVGSWRKHGVSHPL